MSTSIRDVMRTGSYAVIFFRKKPDMKSIILVSNLKEISPSVFSSKKEYIKNYDAILLSTYDSAKQRY